MGEYKLKECVIFDIDGTLSNLDHRQHYLEEKPENWKLFFRSMGDDTVRDPIRRLYWMFLNQDWNIFIFSSRPDSYRAVTESWLLHHGITGYVSLLMRKESDSRPDDIVKHELLTQIRTDGWAPVFAIDDRDQVVKMWRDRDITCLQVAEGDF